MRGWDTCLRTLTHASALACTLRCLVFCTTSLRNGVWDRLSVEAELWFGGRWQLVGVCGEVRGQKKDLPSLAKVLGALTWHTVPGRRRKVAEVTAFLSELNQRSNNAGQRAKAWNQLLEAHDISARCERMSLGTRGLSPWVGSANAFRAIYRLM